MEAIVRAGLSAKVAAVISNVRTLRV